MGPPTPTSLALHSGGNQDGSAGIPLTQPVVVLVSGSQGPLQGVGVSFQVQSGGGHVSPSSVLSGVDGRASATWTLGSSLGQQVLRATAGALPPITVTATASPGPAATILVVAGNNQTAIVERPVAIAPRIRIVDAFGNARSGQPVTFSIKSGGGVLTDSVQVTEAAGEAALGGWILGPAAGVNELQVVSGNVLTALTAFGTAASLVAVDGDQQMTNVGTLTPIAPAVRALNADGAPVANVVVSFLPFGGGMVQGGTRTTDATGLARVGGWVLALVPGQNTLAAQANGVSAVGFEATGVAAVAAAAAALGPAAFDGLLGNLLGVGPTVRVTDGQGRPVAGEPVAFQVLSGGGTLAGANALTDFDGRASLNGWRLGPADADQTAQAAVAALPPVQFSAAATPPPPSQFNITLRYESGTPTPAQTAAFTSAVNRWQGIILGDLSDIAAEFFPAGGCLPVAVNEPIDDVLIFVQLVNIDGAGGVLGAAGPCLIRTSNSLTAVGLMRFDTADLLELEDLGLLESVIVHEMGHVLGFGTLWPELDLVVNEGGADPFFSGPSARAGFALTAAPAVFPGNAVPVENTSGAGTRDVHWRESVLDHELMTGFIDLGVNPLSLITTASVRDMGYIVNDAVSDDYTLPAFLRSLAAPKRRLVEAPIPGPIYAITPSGRVTRVIPR